MELDSLTRQIDRPLRLHFRDGEVVEARLLSVGLDPHDDLSYEVRRVVHPPVSGAIASRLDHVCIASARDLVSWEEVSETEPAPRAAPRAERRAFSAGDPGDELGLVRTLLL